MLMKNPNSEHETSSMAYSTAERRKQWEKNPNNRQWGTREGNNNKGIAAVMDNGIWQF